MSCKNHDGGNAWTDWLDWIGLLLEVVHSLVVVHAFESDCSGSNSIDLYTISMNKYIRTGPS
jgi:hypothetical protein